MADARLIDGKAFAANIRKAVAEKVVGLWENHGLTPKLAVVLVGEDPASAIYGRNKDKAWNPSSTPCSRKQLKRNCWP